MAATIVSIDLSFRDAEHSRSEYHTFANLINVVHAELQLLERMCEPEPELRPAIRLCEAATWAFKDRGAATKHGPLLAEFRTRVRAAVSLLNALPEYREDAGEARALIDEVIHDAHLRIQELLARHGYDRALQELEPDAARSLVIAGASEASGGADDGQVQVSVLPRVLVTVGLLEAAGLLAGILAATAGPVTLTVGSDKSDGPVVTVEGDPVPVELVPDSPPGSLNSTAEGGAARAAVALMCYIAGPAYEVRVDRSGSPILQVVPRPN